MSIVYLVKLMGCFDLYVKAPEGSEYDATREMERIDKHLIRMCPASFRAPNGIPIRENDGTYAVRIYDGNPVTLEFVRWILEEHYGLRCVRLVEYSDDGKVVKDEKL
jgi:hypothetical protein